MQVEFIGLKRLYNIHSNKSHASGLNIDRFDLAELISYRQWRKSLLKSLNRLLLENRLHSSVVDIIRLQLTQDAYIYRIHGSATIIHYAWSNGEIKIIPLWIHQYVTNLDPFWLQYYPFLSRVSHPERLIYTVASMKQLKSHEYREHPYYVSSHNNHFGHFIYDDLVTMGLLRGPLGNCLNNRTLYASYPYKDSISDACSSIGLDYTYSGDLELTQQSLRTSGGYLSSVDQLIQIASGSPYLNAFLWRQTHRIPNVTSHENSQSFCKSRFLLIRSGDYTTRIQNYREVINTCLSYGFEMLDPSLMPIRELIARLANCELIISESGSTSLNALMFGNGCNVIPLVPKRLMLNPTQNMLIGGLPYLLSFSDRIYPVLGETKLEHSIQSSDVCHYNIDELSNMIDRLLT